MKNPNQISKCRKPRGVVLVAVLVVFTLGLTLFGVWTHAALAQHRRLQSHQMRLQTARMAEAGVRRSILRRKLDPEYDGEMWQLPADAASNSQNAQVKIQITEMDNNRAIVFEAVAQFPASGHRRAQFTKRIEVFSSATGESQ